MTETYSNPLTADDILDDETDTARLTREADDLIAGSESPNEGRSFDRTASVRQAVREDLAEGREWARQRGELARDTIRDQPLKTAAYAVGLGVIIGLLLRR